MVKSAYIHIPFCKNICNYCSFCKFFYNEEMASRYLDSLLQEVKSKYKGELLDTIYVGGGTPSDLSIDNLNKLFKIIDIFKLEKDYEFTFECNFDISNEKLKLLKEHGVNRLSFGIEPINKEYYSDINRYNSKKNIINKIKYAREIGFDNINGDLMYGFHNENTDILKNDLDFILNLNLEHISTYSLMIEEHTKLYLNDYKNVDEELDNKMYYMIHDYLINNNYSHYEVSNYAKDGYYSRHNNKYWMNEEYYGFGISASGYISNIRYTNTRSITNYINGEYVYENEEIDIDSKISYEIILGLRLKDGINLDKFYNKYNKKIEDIYDVSDLFDNKYLVKENNKLYIPYDKWYVMNSILIRFVR